MKYGEIKKIIFHSLEQQFCTRDAIKRFVENELRSEIAADDFDGVLERMQNEGKIVLLNNGAFSAYFPADKKPSAFFRAGEGRTNAVYDKPGVGLPILPVTRDYSSEFPETDDEDELDIEITLFFTAAELELIENLTAGNYSKKDIAEQLKVPEQLFALRSRYDLPTRQAIADGARKRREEGDRAAKTIEAEAAADKPAVKPHKSPKQRVIDVRPDARVVVAELSENGQTEAVPRQTPPTARPERLCACGNRLGARAFECKVCWLKRKENPSPQIKTKNDEAVNRKIKDVLATANFDREKLLEITVDLFLESAPGNVKERFAEKLWSELTVLKVSESKEENYVS